MPSFALWTHRTRSNYGLSGKSSLSPIHPLKLATDIGVTPLALYFLWEHRVLPAVLVGFGQQAVMRSSDF
jgi:hypothetical protein